jgi:hypothetical protein
MRLSLRTLEAALALLALSAIWLFLLPPITF